MLRARDKRPAAAILSRRYQRASMASSLGLRLGSMTRNRIAHRRSSRGRMAVRLIVFAAALAGLFVMHGLSDHRSRGHDVNAPMSPAVMAMSHTSQVADEARDKAADAWTGDGVPGEGSPGMAMAGLCLAVLAGAIIGFLLLRPHRLVVAMRTVAVAFVPQRPAGRRDRDPPCLSELSVLRT